MPGEGDLIAIRMRLLGGKEAAAEAEGVTAAIKETGTAAESSAAKSAAGADKEAAARANATRVAKRQAAATRAVGKGMTKWITGSAIAVGAASVYMAANFKRQMGLVATDAGGSRKEVERLEPAVLNLARASQFGPEELATGLFHAESAGYRGAKAMAAMKAATQLATVGNSGFEETMYAVVSATKALGRDGPKAMKRTASEINEIVAHGDIRLSELNAALSTGLLPTARGLGLSVQDVGSALDVMTARGMPAQKSAYALNFTLQKLVPSTEKAEKVFQRLGIGQEQLLVTAQKKGLPAALDLLKKKLDQMPQGQQIKTINEMFGGGRMSKGLLTVIQNLGEVKKIYGELTPDMGEYNRHIKEAEENPLVKLKTAWSSVEASLVELGSVLLPMVVPAFEKLTGFVSTIGEKFDALSPTMKGVVGEAIALAAALGPLILLGGKLFKLYEGIRAFTAVSSMGSAATAEAGAVGPTLGARFGVAGAGVGASLIAGNAVGGTAGNLISGVGSGASLGFAFGGPWGAAAGAALGGIAGILPTLLHSTPKVSLLHREMEHLTEATREYKGSLRGLAASEKGITNTTKAHHKAVKNEHAALHNLAVVLSHYGAESLEANRAQRKLSRAQAAVARTARREQNAHRLAGNELKLYKENSLHLVASIKQTLPAQQRRIKALNREIAEGKNVHENLEQVVGAEKRLNTSKHELTRAFATAENKGGKPWARRLEELTTLQARYGEKGRTLVTAMGKIREHMAQLKEMGLTQQYREENVELQKMAGLMETIAEQGNVGGNLGKGPKAKTGGAPKGKPGKKGSTAQSRRTGPATSWDHSPDSRPSEYWAPSGDAAASSGGVKHMQPIVIQVGRRTLANVVAETQQDDEARL